MNYWIQHVRFEDVRAFESVGWEVATQKLRTGEHSLMMRWMGIGEPVKPTDEDFEEYAKLNAAFFQMGDGA